MATAQATLADLGIELPKGRLSLTVLEVAAALGCTDQHIFDLIEEGKLGAVNVGGGRRNYWRIPIPELARFVESRNSLRVAP